MTRAEEKGLEVFPVDKVPYYGLNCNAVSERDANFDKRCLFIMGYESAEKDTIDRAVAWLKEHANDYIVDLTPTYPDAPVNIIVGGMCWEHLRKAMEEEV